MKQVITLVIVLNTLFLNIVNANESVINQCNAAVNQQDVDTARTLAAQLLKQNKQDKGALICQGRALSLSGDLAGAVTAFNAAKGATQDPFDGVIIHILLGNAYKTAHQPSEAINAYQTSATLANAQNNKNYERISYNLIGDTFSESKQYQEALNFYNKAYVLTANDNERGESYENIALTQHRLGAQDEALAYQIKAFLMHEKVGSLDQFANSSITLGEYYRLNKNYRSAESTLNKIKAFCKAQGGAYFEAKATYTLAKVKLDLGEQSAAAELITQAKKIALDTQDTALMQEIEQTMQNKAI